MPNGMEGATGIGPTYSAKLDSDSEAEVDRVPHSNYNAGAFHLFLEGRLFSNILQLVSIHGSNGPDDPNEDMWSDVSDISPLVGEAFTPATLPVEYLHQRARSPYLLRQNRYPTASRIQQQVRAIGPCSAFALVALR